MAASPVTRPLPRGPHELTREEVQRSQRERMLLAITEAVADKGYTRTAVADVIKRAGVSRATFYDQFADKEDCFRAAFEAIAEILATVLAGELEAARAEYDGPVDDEPLFLLDRLLARYLDLLHEGPAFAKAFLIEVYAAGPRAVEQRRRSLEHFVDLMAETHRGRSGLLGTEPHQRFAAQALAGAAAMLVTNMVGAGETDRLPELHGPIMELTRQLVGRS